MAVESTITSVVYTVTSAAAGQEFPIPFPYIEKEHVVAYYANEGENTSLTYGTDYTVNSSTLTVTGTLPVGAKFVIQRVTPLTQEIVWVDGQAVYTPDIMQADDKLTYITQEFKEQIDRSIKVDASSSQTPEELMEEIFAVREDAAGSASDAAASAALAQAWAESDTPPDPEDEDSKSAKTWAGVSENWSDVAKAWAESDTAPDPDDPDSKSSKTWAAEAAESAAEAAASAASVGGSMYTEAITDLNVGDVADGIIVVTDEPDGDTDGLLLGGVPVGTIIWSGNATVPAGYLLCNGSAVGRETYPELFTAIGTTFGSGDGSTTFNLPNLIDKFIEGANAAGTVKAAGLPDFSGNFSGILNVTANSAASWANNVDGAFSSSPYVSGTNTNIIAGTSGDTYGGLRIKGSDSNAIYGNSSTVQPPAVTALPCIKAFASVIGDATVVAGQLVNEIQSKVALDGSNTSSIGPTLSTYMAHAAMPDFSRYEDYTAMSPSNDIRDLPQAPADGYWQISISSTNATGVCLRIRDVNQKNIYNWYDANSSAVSVGCFVPVVKGAVYEIYFQNSTGTSTMNTFRFIYANGSATA